MADVRFQTHHSDSLTSGKARQIREPYPGTVAELTVPLSTYKQVEV